MMLIDDSDALGLGLVSLQEGTTTASADDDGEDTATEAF